MLIDGVGGDVLTHRRLRLLPEVARSTLVLHDHLVAALATVDQALQQGRAFARDASTRLLPFARPPRGQDGGKGPATFDFLGFTLYWRRSRRGSWVLGLKTRTARLRRALMAVAEYCRRHRHKPVKEQHAGLKRRLVGHFNYFGVNGNLGSLTRLVRGAEHVWRKWLRRRSQRTTLTWKRFRETILRAFPLPSPRISVQIWAP